MPNLKSETGNMKHKSLAEFAKSATLSGRPTETTAAAAPVELFRPAPVPGVEIVLPRRGPIVFHKSYRTDQRREHVI